MTDPHRSSDESSQETSPADLPVPDSLGRDPLPHPSDNHNEPGRDGNVPVSEEQLGRSFRDCETKALFSQEVHQYVREFIRFADQKAAFFFAGSTALLAFLYENGLAARWISHPMTWNIIDVLSFGVVLSLISAVLLSIVVVVPRTGGSRRGLIFWEAIAEYRSSRDYADHVASSSVPTLSRARAEHAYELSIVCQKKYRWLRYAVIAGSLGFVGSLLLFLTS